MEPVKPTPARSRSYVIWLLGRRDYSRYQLEQKLKKRGLDVVEIKAVLENLIEDGWYKEDAYKRVRTRQIIKRGFGPLMARAKLGAERIKLEPGDVEQAYSEIGLTVPNQIRELAEKFLRLRSKDLASLPPSQLKNRVVTALMRKGFRAGDILDELKTLLK